MEAVAIFLQSFEAYMNTTVILHYQSEDSPGMIIMGPSQSMLNTASGIVTNSDHKVQALLSRYMFGVRS